MTNAHVPTAPVAVKLCTDEGVDFEAAFKMQFHLAHENCAAQAAPLPGFAAHKIGPLHLQIGPALPCVRHVDAKRGWSVALLGMAVDAEGAFVDAACLAAHMAASAHSGDLIDRLTRCGGRFAILVCTSEFDRLYMDLNGLVGALRDPQTDWIASSLYLALGRELEPNVHFPLAEAAGRGDARFCFGQTRDQHVERIQPAHYLDLRDGTQHRYWPHPDLSFECDTSRRAIEARIDRIVARHVAIMRAIATNARPSVLPLSGGEDSRLLLAMSLPFLDEIDHLHVHVNSQKSTLDAKLALKLGEIVGRQVEVLNVRHEDLIDDEWMRRVQRENRIAMGFAADAPPMDDLMVKAALAYPEGATCMVGNVTDITKAVLWRRMGMRQLGRDGEPGVDPMIGLRLMMLADEAEHQPWLVQAYGEWRSGIPVAGHRRLYDFMANEQFRGHGLGAQVAALPHSFTIAPSNDPELIRHMMAVPPLVRYHFHLNDMILRRLCPEMLNLPYTRRNDNLMRKERPPLRQLISR